MRNRQRFLLLLLATVALAVALTGCRSKEVSEPEEPLPERQQAPVGEEDMAESREAFGLPLPPQFERLQREERSVQMTTSMSLEELEAFFQSRLHDYETLRLERSLRVVPLRPHSPSVEAWYASSRSTRVLVEYRLPLDPTERARRLPPLPSLQEETDQPEETSPREIIARQSTAPGENVNRPVWLNELQGKPVELRTEDGRLLAPGAVWGEPYTPPEGSPLHTRRNRHNFGRPFGDWSSH